MKEQNQPEYPARNTADEAAVELFVTRLDKIPARITLNGADTAVLLSGEFLFEGFLQDDVLQISGLQTVSLWSEPLEELDGPVTLAGSGFGVEIDAAPQGSIDPIDMRMYYALLSKLEPAYVESDAFYPVLEVLRGRLGWMPYDGGDIDSPAVNLTILLDQLVESYPGAGLITSLALDPVPLPLKMMVPYMVDPEKHHSITPCTGSPLLNKPSTTSISRAQRFLRVRFICSNPAPDNLTLSEMNTLAQEQLQGACDVWWRKGGMLIELEPGIVDVIQDSGLNQSNTITGIFEEADLPNRASANSKSPDAVEIYLIKDLVGTSTDPRRGGGVTLDCGSPNAFIILDIDKAKNNRYLLAHEIGHVLRIGHPANVGGNIGPFVAAGSACSVSLPDRPTSPRNTEDNMLIPVNQPPPLGACYQMISNASCYWRPDPDRGFFHIVRDHPYDDGTEPTTQSGSSAWTRSDVWNAYQPPQSGDNLDELYLDRSPMFNDDHTPIHSQPRRTGSNEMCVRLRVCQFINQDVRVHLFLSPPGVSTQQLIRLTGSTPLTFFPTGQDHVVLPGQPHTQSISWTVPSGYPSQCSMFAVAESGNELDQTLLGILRNPRYSSLAVRAGTDNDVAQRAINVEEVSMVNGMQMSTSLSWISIANPFDDGTQASLEITATDDGRLNGLQVELDGVMDRQIRAGESCRIPLVRVSNPGEEQILRLHAILAAGLGVGTEVPIDLLLFAGDELVTGFSHLIRIATLEQAAFHTLDNLYGAIIDVQAAFGMNSAGSLAVQLAEIARGSQNNFARALERLPSLGSPISSLASELDGNGHPVHGEISRRLLEVSDLLAAYGQRLDDPQLFTNIRELADRIQEPAGRLVRMAH